MLVQELAEVWADERKQGNRTARKEHSVPPEDCSHKIRKCPHTLRVNYPLLVGIDCLRLKFVGY